MKKLKVKLKVKKVHLLNTSLAILLTFLIIILYQVIFTDKFFPGIYVGDINLTFLTKDQANRVLSSKYNSRSQTKLQFSSQHGSFEIDLATSSAQVNYVSTLDQAFEFGHSGPWGQKLLSQILALGKKTYYPEVSFSLDEVIKNIAPQVDRPPKDAKLNFKEDQSTTSAQISLSPAEDGLGLDQDKLKEIIKTYLVFGKTTSEIPLMILSPKVSTSKAETIKQALEKNTQEAILLEFKDQSWTLDTKTLIPLVQLKDSSNSLLSSEALTNYLKKEVASHINQPVKEGQFNFDASTKKVTNFVSSQEGQELDVEKTVTLINLALIGARPKTITLPVATVAPKIKTEQVNDLGIKELLGQGVSNFAGSIPNRIYNLSLAASRINGVLIPPGEVFSFNDKVGDISANSGYKQAYVIKEGRTVLDDGGGVCQDSTTLFRAVLNAGLPVVQRVAHAYRVGYYEQGFPPGLDATVFAPSVDFKFKNDTPAYVLIQAYTSGLTLYVDLYGSPDGRVVSLTKPIVTNQTSPPPELRQDDPTLPKGQVKQVDFPAWGANVSFKRTVTKNGQVIIDETWRSNFKPWQAVYLVGTKE